MDWRFHNIFREKRFQNIFSLRAFVDSGKKEMKKIKRKVKKVTHSTLGKIALSATLGAFSGGIGATIIGTSVTSGAIHGALVSSVQSINHPSTPIMVGYHSNLP